MENALTPTAATTPTSALAAKKPSKELDKDSFLKLLVAQLKNQDPSQAQDTGQMVQQMTSFASLEQSQNTNTLLSGIQVQNQGLFQAQAATMVGKRVRVTASSYELSGGKASLGLNLPAEANVSVVIKDPSGKIVRVLEPGIQAAGDHVLDWDGLDLNGTKLADGHYSVEVAAQDAKGGKVDVTTSAFVHVDSILFSNGNVYLLAGGRQYSLTDVTEISA
jgi:flagellar basal-body rod modification protein FlgD